MVTAHDGSATSPASHSVNADLKHKADDIKDKEILRLQRTLTEAKTTNRARESQLRVAKEGLKNAREALNETFAEYASVRDELNTVKQVLGRDHQATLYRKDIEIFALRKMNEQREKSLADRDNKLKELESQHKADMERKEEQMKLLTDRLQSASCQDRDDGEQALEVRLLKVKKGRKSFEMEDEKDVLISQLQDSLAAAEKSAEAVVNKQAELQRAWDITKKIQNTLKEERDRHTQTREQLQGVMAQLSQENEYGQSYANMGRRLPTIEEDEHGRSELEAMFEAAQEDNVQLKSKVRLLEKRLQDANAKIFSAAQEADALRVQIRFEQNCKADMEKARPSVIHHVHLQNMEDHVKELQRELGAKDEEIRRHKKSIVQIDRYVGRLRREIDAAIGYHTEDQDEIERLKEIIAELQSTNNDLAINHEQTATGRTRRRSSTAKNPLSPTSDVSFIRKLNPSSRDATSTPRYAPASTMPPVIVATAPRLSGQPPAHHKGRRGSAKEDVRSNGYPTTELETSANSNEEKSARRTSLGLRDIMKKITRKDHDDPIPTHTSPSEQMNILLPGRSEREDSRYSRASTTTTPRPTTANASALPEPIRPVTGQPVPAITSVPHKTHPSNPRRSSMKYYTTASDVVDERPLTAAGSKESSAPKRRSWGASVQTKLNRRSLH